MATPQDAMPAEEVIEQYLAQTDPEQFADEETGTPEQEEAVSEATDEEQEVEASAEEQQEVEVETEEGEEEGEVPWMPESLDDLASAMEVETDDLRSIRVKTKVDGVEGEATLGDVIKNYQLNKSLTDRSEAFARERKAHDETFQKLQSSYEEKIKEAELLTQTIEQSVANQISQVDWDQLRAENPAEWTAKRQEFMEQIGELEASKTKIAQEREKQQQEMLKEQKEKYAQFLQYSTGKLIEAIPEFKDAEVRQKEMQSLKTYLLSQGITEQEVNMVSDYRTVLLARKAMAYDNMQDNAAPAKKKAKTVPKFRKPGAAKTKQNSNDALTKKRYKRAAESQNTDDWAKVLEDRLFG